MVYVLQAAAKKHIDAVLQLNTCKPWVNRLTVVSFTSALLIEYIFKKMISENAKSLKVACKRWKKAVIY